MSRDPIGYEGSWWHLYRYLSSAPVSGSDPTGQCEEKGEEEDPPTDVPLPKNPPECEGFCLGAPKSGGKLEFTLKNCNITSFKKDPNNSWVCPSPNSAQKGCELLIKQLNKVQNDAAEEKENKGWSFNLCGPCLCDWEKGRWFKPSDGDLKITFNNTWIGQWVDTGVGTIKCRYQITGSITVTVKQGSVVLAPCKKK